MRAVNACKSSRSIKSIPVSSAADDAGCSRFALDLSQIIPDYCPSSRTSWL